MTDPLPSRIAWFAPWTWKRRWMACAIAVCFILAAYPLSFGPMYGLAARRLLSPAFMNFAYWPLMWVANKYRPLWDLLLYYARFFKP